MPSLESPSAIHRELIGSRRSQAAAHLALSKKLISEISRTRKLPTATTCAEDANFYDRVAHL